MYIYINVLNKKNTFLNLKNILLVFQNLLQRVWIKFTESLHTQQELKAN